MKYKKVPKIDRKTGQQIGFRFEFRRYNPSKQRNDPVLRESLPEHIRNASEKDEDVVRKYCESREAEDNAISYRAKARAEWLIKYEDFDEKLKLFSEYQELSAPNSFENDVYYLKYYGFAFFLGVKDSNQIQNWPLHFNEFRTWLSTVKPLKWEKENLSFSTQNKIVKAVNRFIQMYSEANGLPIVKCKQHDRNMLNKVKADDLITDSEKARLIEALHSIRPVSSDVFRVLVNTGLRVNELLGLCTAFVIEGPIEGQKSKKIHEQLSKYGLGEYYGYICLESQPRFEPPRISAKWTDPKTKEIWKKGSVPRKPLKTRKSIDPKWYRYIPIFDKDTWNTLVRRWNERIEESENQSVEIDPRDGLLFEGITASMFYADCVKAFTKLGLKFRSPHKLRHTFLTWFYDKTNEDLLLAKKVGGHEDLRSMENYSHLTEQIGLERTRFTQKKSKMKMAT